jgi:hypothetical protein
VRPQSNPAFLSTLSADKKGLEFERVGTQLYIPSRRPPCRSLDSPLLPTKCSLHNRHWLSLCSIFFDGHAHGCPAKPSWFISLMGHWTVGRSLKREISFSLHFCRPFSHLCSHLCTRLSPFAHCVNHRLPWSIPYLSWSLIPIVLFCSFFLFT